MSDVQEPDPMDSICESFIKEIDAVAQDIGRFSQRDAHKIYAKIAAACQERADEMIARRKGRWV